MLEGIWIGGRESETEGGECKGNCGAEQNVEQNGAGAGVTQTVCD